MQMKGPYTKVSDIYLTNQTLVRPFPRAFANVPAVTIQRSTVKMKRQRTGYSLPGWKDVILAGGDATTPMEGTFQSCGWRRSGDSWFQTRDHWTPASQEVFTVRTTGNAAGSKYLAVHVNSHQNYYWSLASGTVYNRALIKFLNAVRQAVVQFEGGVFLGELRESLRMIRHPAEGLKKKIYDYQGRVRTARNRNPKTWTKTLSEMWLENAFGWQPLINDIEDAYDLWDDLSKKEEGIPVRKSAALADEVKAWRLIDYLTYVDPSIPHRLNSRTIEKVKYAFYGIVQGQVKTTYADTLKTWGLSSEPMDWAPVAWEILPWSFLIDYFSNIGDVISASTAVQGSLRWWNARLVRTLTSELTCQQADLSTLKGAYNRAIACGTSPSEYQLVTKYVNRAMHPLLDTPRLEFEVPKLARQWTNMGALLVAAQETIYPQRPRPRGSGNPLRFRNPKRA